MRNAPVDRIMTENPAPIGPQESIAKARWLLLSLQVHHLPVVDNGRLVGIVSSTDLIRHKLADDMATAADGAAVDQIMQLNPVVLESTATLRDAASALIDGRLNSLPVVDADRSLVGIVTSSDLIEALQRALPVGDGSIVEAPEMSLAGLIEHSKRLQAACNAAELYLRSGHGEHEHSVLSKCLAALRSSDEPVAV